MIFMIHTDCYVPYYPKTKHTTFNNNLCKETLKMIGITFYMRNIDLRQTSPYTMTGVVLISLLFPIRGQNIASLQQMC